MPFQAAALTAYCVKYARDAMAYLVLDNITNEQGRDVNAYHRIYEVHPIECLILEPGSEYQLYLLYYPMQQVCSYRRKQAHQKT